MNVNKDGMINTEQKDAMEIGGEINATDVGVT